MSLRPKKDHVTISILGLYTHRFGGVEGVVNKEVKDQLIEEATTKTLGGGVIFGPRNLETSG